ncbi:MAG TPA: hypothetical protein VGF55_26005 [Gemmataceae bacterium]|jgi:hypothetical protein
MTHPPFSRRAPLGGRPWATLATLAGGLLAASARAQAPTPPAGDVIPAYAQAIINGTDSGVVQAGCATCGGGLPPVAAITTPIGGGGGPCACSDDSCGSCMCKPGKPKNCNCLGECSDCFLGRFGSGFINCICCPDPCYEGVWSYPANAAFFQDTVRPQTYTRIRWDSGVNVRQPERAEYFWAAPGAVGGRGPQNVERRVDYDVLSLYQEIAAGNFAFFINTPYVGVEPDNNPAHSNFGDLDLGTKSLLIDCELMQLTFQFRTYTPTGFARHGLGTGHVSLEPSLLASIKLMPDTYLQTQVAYWIPIGGDQDFEGATWRYGVSLNRQWFHRGPFALISTAEFNGWTFTDGAIVNRGAIDAGIAASPMNRAQLIEKGSAESYFTLGGGLRLVICDKYDIGFGAQFAVTDDHFAEQLYRTEFRIRY